MSSRCGDIDPFVIPFVMDREGLSTGQVREVLTKQSGLLGISGLSGDYRDLAQAAAQGHERARLALDLFAYEIKKYIGAYAAVLGGLDALIFTGGIGENARELRWQVSDGLEFLGIELDSIKNDRGSGERVISKESSHVIVAVMPTNEELIVARETVRVLSNR